VRPFAGGSPVGPAYRRLTHPRGKRPLAGFPAGLAVGGRAGKATYPTANAGDLVDADAHGAGAAVARPTRTTVRAFRAGTHKQAAGAVWVHPPAWAMKGLASMTENETTIPADVLATLHQRRAAGESLASLAKELGIPWQRLWVLLVSTQPKVELPATRPTNAKQPAARTHRQFDELMGLVGEGHANIMLVGPAGTGKTTLVKHVAEALDRPFAFISLSAGVTETHLFGRMLPQSDGTWAYQESPFIRIYRNGGVFLFDEVDAADGNVMVSVNAALANGVLCNPVTGEVIQRHADCTIVTAANTYGRGGDMVYVGRNALDGATLDRFVLAKLFVGYDVTLEHDIARSVLDSDTARELLNWVDELRGQIAANRLRRIASTRLIAQGVKALAAGKTLEDVKERFFQDWSADELAKVGREVSHV